MASGPQPDLVIRDALLIDGSGKPGVRGDLAIKDDHITALGDLGHLKGARQIEANGLASSTPTPMTIARCWPIR
jgi:N-acyl-D-aspartate/D-glutamate deacylase